MAGKQAHQHQNITVFEEMKPGDLIEFHRGLYSHWAVALEQGRIIHLSGEGDGISGNVGKGHSLFTICGQLFDKAQVQTDDFWEVVGDSKATINNSKDGRFAPGCLEDIVDRAVSKMGKVGYNVITCNCEHFASWCRYGVHKSDQADKATTGFWVAAAGILTVGVGFLIKSWRDKPSSEDDEDQVQHRQGTRLGYRAGNQRSSEKYVFQ